MNKKRKIKELKKHVKRLTNLLLFDESESLAWQNTALELARQLAFAMFEINRDDKDEQP